jgi:hydrogenase maturation factor HypF (carbamoyltransferase family)
LGELRSSNSSKESEVDNFAAWPVSAGRDIRRRLTDHFLRRRALVAGRQVLRDSGGERSEMLGGCYMKLTAAEKKLVLQGRKKAEAAAKELTEAHDVLSKFFGDLDDAQVVQLARQVRAEVRRITTTPGRCTCDSQWTNPKCPRVLAGWGGFDCNEAPEPIITLKMRLGI